LRRPERPPTFSSEHHHAAFLAVLAGFHAIQVDTWCRQPAHAVSPVPHELRTRRAPHGRHPAPPDVEDLERHSGTGHGRRGGSRLLGSLRSRSYARGERFASEIGYRSVLYGG